ncbi:hypothetical protein FK521_29065, partial [Klebsiella pneumoniae]|nr:hypothetical protein [Klebsiella pneumoniae]
VDYLHRRRFVAMNGAGKYQLAKSMAEIIQANLRQVGVQVTLVGEEESSIYARQREGIPASVSPSPRKT